MYKYQLFMYWSEEDQIFVVEVPELPGCIGTSICINLVSSCNPDIAFILPNVAFSSFPWILTSGYPNVKTSSPTSEEFALINGIGLEFCLLFTLMIAMSLILSDAINFASCSLPSIETVIFLEFFIILVAFGDCL